MTAVYSDILGNPLDIGDDIVVAFPNGGSNAELRIGTITGIVEKPTQRWNPSLKAYFPGPPTYTLDVKWDKDRSAYGVPEKSKMSKPKGRILKLS